MGDLHEVVVDDVGEVVGGQAVGLEEDGVFEGGFGHVAASLEGPEGAVDEVFVDGVLIGDFEADGVGFAAGGAVVAL